MSESVLDPAIVKDLLNHIYEKRKATAFQIEGFTKSALARNDSAAIYKIIAELTELANGGSTSAKMGSITALGSVSVALGSFAIAYFLDDIVRPIFATFKDTDARVRYYACESLYNIAKIARGEVLLYFNEIFDILCILVTDTESSVKNAADILDRLIKDIVSAKSTSYVSILNHQTGEENDIVSNVVNVDGVAIQVNEVQDSLKAFLLSKFIPTLLERMFTVDPFAKKFLLSWLELFDDIPLLELITFLPNFLEPLLRFLMNSCPSDVRIETQNLLNIFLKEIKSIHKVKHEVKKVQILKDIIAKKESSERESPDLLADGVKDLALPEDDDSLSIKSSSTTIIRKPDVREPDVLEDEYHEEVGTVFINGQDIFIDYPKIIDILLSFLRTGVPHGTTEVKINDLAGESHEIYLEIQATVLKWLQEIVTINPTSFSKFLPDCVSINMQNVALTDDNNDIDLRNQFLTFNLALQTYLLNLNESIKEEQKPNDISDNVIHGLNKEVYDEFLELYLNKTLRIVTGECLLSVNELARLTLLEWLTFLYLNYTSSFFTLEGDVNGSTERYTFDLTSLLRSSTDASHEVISKVLQLASQISEDNQDFFRDFIVKLIWFFETDGVDSVKSPSLNNGNSNGAPPQSALSRSKVEFIIKRLCVSISAEKIFKTLSEVLVTFEKSNLDFISNIIVTLNNILLTAHELLGLRKKLKNLDFYKTEDWILFSALFQSWCHNAPSALSLCLLTSNYELAFLIIKDLAELEVTFQLLTQLDILVQLLESPIFLKLRLQLLEPEKYPFLFKTLYGILMIMPQSSTYTTLKNRLSSLTNVNFGTGPGPVMTTPSSTSGPVSSSSSASTQLNTKRKRTHELADKFAKVNEMHENYTADRRQRESFEDPRGPKKHTVASIASPESRPLMKDYFPHAQGDHLGAKFPPRR